MTSVKVKSSGKVGRLSKRKIDCEKIPIDDKKKAEKLAEIKSKQWGVDVRVYVCEFCRRLHITTSRNGRPTAHKSRNAPETMRMQRKRYKNRQKLPIEVWEGEGGALHPSEMED